MVKIGILYEGSPEGQTTEEILFKSDYFRDLLKRLNIDLVIQSDFKVNNVINLKSKIQIFKEYGATKIFVLKDLDNEDCHDLKNIKTKAIKKYQLNNKCELIYVIKEFESWLIADLIATKKVLGIPQNENISFGKNPENIIKPSNMLKEELKKHGNKTLNTKTKITKEYIKNGFSLEEAAKHTYCKSAKYFIQKLKEISENNKN